MATTFLEPGGDADFGIALWPNNGGGTDPVVATDFVHGAHIKSLKYATGQFSYVLATGKLTTAGGRLSLYIYLNALPSATAPIFQLEDTADGDAACSVLLTTGGVLRFGTGAAHTLIGSAGSTLSTATWYRISLAYTISSTTVNQLRLFKNGTLDITASNVTLDIASAVDLQLGNGDSDGTLDFRSSDHYIDNSTALTDPGDIWVTAKRPNANGAANAFTTQIGAGGSGYGSGHSPQVNERPLSATNGWSLSNTTRATEEYSVESAATGDIDISAGTLVDYMGWISASVNSTANSPVHRIIVNNVTTAKTMTTSTAAYTQVAGSATYPAGSTDIGMDAQYTTTPHLTRLLECGIIFAYIPASGYQPRMGFIQHQDVGLC